MCTNKTDSCCLRIWFIYVFDSSVYAAFASYYFLETSGLSDKYFPLFAEVVVMLVLVVRFRGFESIIAFSAFSVLISVIPALLFYGFAFKYANPSIWTDTSGRFNCMQTNETNSTMIMEQCESVQMRWGPFLSIAAWYVIVGLYLIHGPDDIPY